jgi:hypothetical protein
MMPRKSSLHRRACRSTAWCARLSARADPDLAAIDKYAFGERSPARFRLGRCLPLACTRSSAFMALSGSGPHVVLERRVPKPHHNGVPARDHCHDLAVVAGRRQWCRGEGPASAQRGRINPAKMLSPECRISNSELTSGPSRLTPVPAETSPNGSEWVSVPVSSPTRGGRAHDSTLCAMVSPHDQR